MASLNKVFLIGNLTRDPEIRYTPQGVAVATLGLAVNRVFKGQNGEKKDETLFINVTAWRQLAENCGRFLSKGRQVFVEGRLQMRSWKDNDGKNRSVIEVVADNLQFISPKAEKSSDENRYSAMDGAIEEGFKGETSLVGDDEIVIPGEEEMF